MALSAFDDRTHEPTAAELETVLGRSSAQWLAMLKGLAAAYPPLEQTWSFSGAKWGWSLRLRQEERTVCYMTPCRRHFLVGLVLGKRAVEAARDAGLSDAVMAAIVEAPQYPEGRGVRLPVRNSRERNQALALAAVKMAH